MLLSYDALSATLPYCNARLLIALREASPSVRALVDGSEFRRFLDPCKLFTQYNCLELLWLRVKIESGCAAKDIGAIKAVTVRVMAAALDGDLVAVKSAVAIFGTAVLSAELFAEAASGSNARKMLEYLRDVDCPTDEIASLRVAARGDIETFQWMHENGIPICNGYIFEHAAAKRQKQFIKYVYDLASTPEGEEYADCYDVMYDAIAKNNDVDMLQFLRDECPDFEYPAACTDIGIALEKHSKEYLQFLIEEDYAETVLNIAEEEADEEMLQFVRGLCGQANE
jgi:hypothetical protein